MTLGLAALALVLLTAALLGTRELRLRDETGRQRDQDAGVAAAPRVRTLAEAPEADLLSVIVYKSDGTPGPALFVSSGEDEFNALASALAQSQPAAGATDESFDHLLVVSFGRNDVLYASYSPSRNLIFLEEQVYTPAADLVPLIAAIDDRIHR